MALYRVKTRWSGFTGSPGYTILHFDAAVDPNQVSAQACYDATHAFFSSVQSVVASAVRFTVETTVEVVEESNGMLVDAFNATAKSALSGMATGGFAASAGAAITWTTPEIRNGRRVRGRTFIVPMAANTYETDGTLTSSSITSLTNASQALIDSPTDFHVFQRPTAKGATDGGSATVVGFKISDKAAVLKSRRD